MCLIGFALEADARFALVFAANRDEYFDRPAEPAAWWRDRPELFGGRDLEGGGTWLLVTRHGAFAAVTNVRQGLADRTAPRSRGELPLLAIEGREAEIRADAQRFGGFNLVAGTLRPSPRLWWISNRAGGECAHAIEPGVHGLANGGFDDPWPKVQSLQAALRAALDGPAEEIEPVLLEALASRAQPGDDALPDTGIGIERERLLAPVFIRTELYGTRTSTLVTVERSGLVRVLERTWPHTELDHVAAFSERRTEFMLRD